MPVSKKETGKGQTALLYLLAHPVTDFCLEILNQRHIETEFTLEGLFPDHPELLQTEFS